MIWAWEDLEEIDKNTNEYNSRQSVVCAIISVEIKCDKNGERNLVGDRSVCWNLSSVQLSSVTQSCPTLCDPMDCSTPGLAVHHQLPEFTQTHVHWVSDAIKLSHPLLSPSPPTSIFPSIRVFSSESVLCIRWPKYWRIRFSISPSNEYSGLITFRMDWLDLLTVQGTLKSLL